MAQRSKVPAFSSDLKTHPTRRWIHACLLANGHPWDPPFPICGEVIKSGLYFVPPSTTIDCSSLSVKTPILFAHIAARNGQGHLVPGPVPGPGPASWQLGFAQHVSRQLRALQPVTRSVVNKCLHITWQPDRRDGIMAALIQRMSPILRHTGPSLSKSLPLTRFYFPLCVTWCLFIQVLWKKW